MSTLSQVRLIEVWRALGGPEPSRGRAPAWWRDSRDPNVSINNERDVYYDHVQNCGGGVLTLVETVLSCDRANALTWLETEGFIAHRSQTHEQQQEHDRRRSEAKLAALDITCWRSAYVSELNTRKAAALQIGCDLTLAGAASTCNLLENGTPTDIIREFIRQRMADPATVARFVALGEKHEEEARRITGQIVLLLAQEQRKGLQPC